MIGTLSVALIAYVGWLLFRSMTVATIAALLAAVDGLIAGGSLALACWIFSRCSGFWRLCVSGA